MSIDRPDPIAALAALRRPTEEELQARSPEFIDPFDLKLGDALELIDEHRLNLRWGAGSNVILTDSEGLQMIAPDTFSAVRLWVHAHNRRIPTSDLDPISDEWFPEESK